MELLEDLNEKSKKKRGRPKKVSLSCSMELGDDLIEKPKKKRGRPKKENQVNDALIPARIEHLNNDMDDMLLLTDQNPNEKFQDKMLTGSKKRGRSKKKNVEDPKKKSTTELNKVGVISLLNLCQSNLFVEEYNPFENDSPYVFQMKQMEFAPDVISSEEVDPAEVNFSAEDVAPRKEEELHKVDVPTVFKLCQSNLSVEEYNPFENGPPYVFPMEQMVFAPDVISTEKVVPAEVNFSAEDVAPRKEEELINTSNDAVNVSDNCTSTSLLRCSVRLQKLAEDEKQKYLNRSMDVNEPADKSFEKDCLLENLGNFMRYKGSSTRGNFLNTVDLQSSNSAHHWCFKFSDDSSDEDYLPDNQVTNKKKDKWSNDDLDWSPDLKKCLKRKNTKNFPANTKVKSVKCNKAAQASTKLNDSSAGNLLKPSADNSSAGTCSYDLYSSGKCDPLTKPEHNVNLIKATPTNLTHVSKKNSSQISSMERLPQLIPKLKVTKSSTGLEVKCQVARTSTFPSEKPIEIIDVSSDSTLEDESMKTLTSDCPSSNLTETTDMSKYKNLQITPIKLQPNLPISKTGESRSTLKLQRKRTKSQVLRKSASNDSEKVIYGSGVRRQEVAQGKHESCLKSGPSSSKQQKYSKQLISQTTWDSSHHLVPKKNNSQSIRESIDMVSIGTRPPYDVNIKRKHSKDEISQESNKALSTDIPEDNSPKIAPIKDYSKLTNLNVNKFQTMRNIQRTLQSILKKRNQPHRRVFQASDFPSNRLTDASGSSDLQTESMIQDSQSVPESNIEKLPNISEDETCRISDRTFNEADEIDDALEENSLQMALNFKSMSDITMPTTGYSVKHQELNVEVPFERQSQNSNSLNNRCEQKVEHSSIPLTSDIFDECTVHCNKFACNLDTENASELLSGCIYCKTFAQLDAIATLATADLGENPNAYIECQIESTEAMYDKLMGDGEVDLKLKDIAFKNRGLKYGRDYLSSFGSFINVSEYFLKSIELEIDCEK